MKTYIKLFIGCTAFILVMMLPQKGISQHYANLSPGDNNQNSKKLKKSIISFGFFSPLNRHVSFQYDQLIGTDLILSSQLGIIGPGVTQTNYPAKGFFLEVGPKLFFSPTWIMDGMRRMNAMQGGYFKPEIIISTFSQSYSYYYYSYQGGGTITQSHPYTGVALMLNIGHQWVMANSFSIDMYFGMGYNVSSFNTSGTLNNNYTYNNEPYNYNYYSYLTTGPDFPLAFSAGINIGVPF